MFEHPIQAVSAAPRPRAAKATTSQPAPALNAPIDLQRGNQRQSLRGIGILAAIVCFASPAPVAAAAPQPRCAPIAGEWTGTSSCLDRSAVPNCVEEQVRFRFSRGAGDGHIILDAMKRSGDRYISMGAAEFACGQQGEWQSRIATPQYSGLWTLELRAGALVAELRIEPSNVLARRATLRQ